MEQLTDQSNSSGITKSIPLLIIPWIKSVIPRLFIRPLNGKMYVNVQLSHTKALIESLHLFLKLIKSKQEKSYFGVEHNKGGDPILWDFNFKIECFKHKKPFENYCQQCEINTCCDCTKKHKYHRQIALKTEQYQEPNINVFEEIKANNRRLTNALINRLRAEGISQGNYMRASIQSACDSNEQINDDLKVLYLCLTKTTALDFKSNQSYELMKLQSLVINTKQYIEEDRSIEAEYKALKEHLETNYVLKQIPSNDCIVTLADNNNSVNCLIQLRDGRLVTGSTELKIWDLATNQCVTTIKDFFRFIYSFMELNDGRLACICPCQIKIWSTASCNKFCQTYKARGCCLINLKEGRMLVSNGEYDMILDLNTGKETQLPEYIQKNPPLIELTDGRFAYLSYLNQKNISLYDRKTLTVDAELVGHLTFVAGLIQMKDGRLASGSADCIRLWNLATHECVASFTGRHYCLGYLCQLNDERLAFRSFDKTILILNTQSKSVVAFHIYTDCIAALIQLNDGRLVSAVDGSLNIWDI